MTMLWLQNLAFYSLQIAAIAAAGALLLRLLRIRLPNVRLICWQALLAACLLLPAIQPRRPKARVASAVQVSTGSMIPVVKGSRPQPLTLPWPELALLILGAGVTVRFAMLGLGFWRIRRYRRNSRFAPGAFASLQRRLGVFADVRLSPDISGPVTFGFLRPVILVPEGCIEDESIACHELLHVQRRDWLFAVAEECILAVMWFHPALWYLIAEIQLAREEAVDREVVNILNSRDQYLEALLALATSRSGLDLVPASPFLRKRHLQKRVASLLKEVSMSRLRLNTSLAAFVAAVALIGWLSVRSFPLRAAPQSQDSSEVTVQAGSLTLLHRAPVSYPPDARVNRIEGTVILELSIGEKGTVTDARVLSGPEELRSAALQSVLQWHYANDAHAPTKTQAIVNFHLDANEGSGVGKGNRHLTAPPPPPPPPPPATATVDSIILSVPDELKQKLQGRLTLREGDQLTGQVMTDLYNAITAVDEHLRLNIQSPNGQKGSTVTIMLQNAAQAQAVAPNRIIVGGGVEAAQVQAVPGTIRIGGGVADANLIRKVTPLYPSEAKAARIQGVVRFNATIGKDGSVLNLTLLSGHPLLVQSAQDAVRQWLYKPTLLNGNPVEVATQIEVNFTLSQ
jgi:protein TonB